MGNDIRGNQAAAIASAKVFETSDNIRCGKYKMLLKRIIDGMITTKDGDRPGVIIEMTPLVSEPLPQTEGNMLLGGAVVPWGTAGATLMDDGNTPCAVGATVALKIFFDGPGARSAPGNVRQFVLGLFNKHEGEIANNDIAKTWCEFTLDRPVKKGETLPNSPPGMTFVAERDLIVNPICGMVIDCVCTTRKKSKTNEKGSHISKPTFSNRSMPGTGENTADMIVKRRGEIEAMMADDDDAVADAPTPAPGANGTNGAVAAAPTPPVAAAAPPAPPSAPWAPPAPWHKPANHPQYVVNADPTKDWWWNGGSGADAVKSTAQLRAQS